MKSALTRGPTRLAEKGITGRPLPSLTGATGQFYSWCAAGELRFQSCEDCGRLQHPPRLRCPACSSYSLTWLPSSGRGRIVTFTIVQRPLHPAFADTVPYTVAIAEMAEGVRLLAQLTETDIRRVAIGAPVVVEFERVPGEMALPVFRLAG